MLLKTGNSNFGSVCYRRPCVCTLVESDPQGKQSARSPQLGNNQEMPSLLWVLVRQLAVAVPRIAFWSLLGHTSAASLPLPQGFLWLDGPPSPQQPSEKDCWESASKEPFPSGGSLPGALSTLIFRIPHWHEASIAKDSDWLHNTSDTSFLLFPA